jgi:hypothetical protein
MKIDHADHPLEEQIRWEIIAVKATLKQMRMPYYRKYIPSVYRI